MTQDEVANAVAADVKAQFDAAADPETHLLTKEGALKSGWGWAADHFDTIDTRKKGAIGYKDVICYLNRSAVLRLQSS
jgi:hypothetical protein